MKINILNIDVDWENLSYVEKDKLVLKAMECYGMNPGWHEKCVNQLVDAWNEHVSYELRSAVRDIGEDESPAKAWHALHELNKCCAEMGMPDYADVEYGDGMAALDVANAMVKEMRERR